MYADTACRGIPRQIRSYRKHVQKLPNLHGAGRLGAARRLESLLFEHLRHFAAVYYYIDIAIDELAAQKLADALGITGTDVNGREVEHPNLQHTAMGREKVEQAENEEDKSVHGETPGVRMENDNTMGKSKEKR